MSATNGFTSIPSRRLRNVTVHGPPRLPETVTSMLFTEARLVMPAYTSVSEAFHGIGTVSSPSNDRVNTPDLGSPTIVSFCTQFVAFADTSRSSSVIAGKATSADSICADVALNGRAAVSTPSNDRVNVPPVAPPVKYRV